MLPDLFQHPNKPRPMATEATDENGEEALAFYHHTAPRGSSLSLVFLLVASTIPPPWGGEGQKTAKPVSQTRTHLGAGRGRHRAEPHRENN